MNFSALADWKASGLTRIHEPNHNAGPTSMSRRTGLKTKIAAICGAALSSAFLALAQVPPVPIPGGDVIAPGVQVHIFSPGSTELGGDGLNAELNGITNFQGLSALAYTNGTATDKTGRNYIAQTDIRLYVGEYVGTDNKTHRGVFVEI